MVRIGILGYGNIGKGTEIAVAQADDMELVAVFTRRNPESVKIMTEGVPVVSADKVGYGFDALKEEYADMMASGIVDPTKVTRSALQNAASVASMVLTTESLVADIKENTPAPAVDPSMGGMY